MWTYIRLRCAFTDHICEVSFISWKISIRVQCLLGKVQRILKLLSLFSWGGHCAFAFKLSIQDKRNSRLLIHDCTLFITGAHVNSVFIKYRWVICCDKLLRIGKTGLDLYKDLYLAATRAILPRLLCCPVHFWWSTTSCEPDPPRWTTEAENYPRS